MQKPKLIKVFFLLSCIIVYITSCNTTTSELKYIPKTEGIKATMQLIRFEQSFFAIDSSNISDDINKLKLKYPEFTNGFLATVLGIRDTGMQNMIIKGYLNYPDARFTFDTIQKVFSNMNQTQKELNELATYYQYYFPNAKPITKAFSYLSEYHGDRLAVIEDGFVALPLDMALGIGYPAYTFSKMPLYDQRTCTKEHLVAKAANAVAQNVISRKIQKRGSHLIDLMLYNGKIMYLTDILAPNIADSLKFGFSSYQINYCQKGELELYNYLLEQELFYSNETNKISKYITKGPFKPNFDLPGNSGTWLGYRIILSYANHYRTILHQTDANLSARSIDQKVLNMIFKELNPQAFLKLYKPPKF
ncbi:MAG: hypothetical protein MK207_12025 [Saprospiraceae bacterium]|nr:hypothetical protein [Saprospiraceae bacterium]